MKRKLIIALLLSCISIYANYLPPVSWSKGVNSYKMKMLTIKKDRIPIILYIYATWCPYCRKMNNKLANENVKDYLDGFTKIAIDGGGKHKSKVLKKIMSKYGIKGFPTLLLIFPSGNYKGINIPTKISDSKFLRKLKRRIGRKAYRMSRKGVRRNKLDRKEIADLYNNNGTKPKIIEFSDDVGEHSHMRAYKVVTEDSNAKFYNNLGDMYLAKRQYHKSKNQYFEALKFDKKSERAYYGLGKSYYLLSKKIKGFMKLKYLKKSKYYLQTAGDISGIYIDDVKIMLKTVNKAIKKENKKYTVIKP